ncbi:phosphoadenylyl-sulfate reductase [Terrihabitans rhizophilus]|uniref:Adenosine 5'-phosphosulfate reductase n=1 Tax=Terrihabitans rhizophilus TaxID=3092662 RepID=A0ABU4RQG9_9HYPH|nr:phosphoadenylyl-sulfate reductase [Terrihabitans sp. PJ23]MDX6806846.1 phosphoadenylyl-sulfate reductase [Terrihabitans sp. PJ23]
MFDLAETSSADLVERARDLDARLTDKQPLQVLEAILAERFEGGIASVSSFGTESAVLLHMVAQIDPDVPVLFLDTGMLFEETLAYRDQLREEIGLKDIRIFTPDVEEQARLDPENMLWATDTNACCGFRKVAPLGRALNGFGAWLNGRKRYHGDSRAALPMVEADGPRIKVNPLANFNAQDIQSYFVSHHLPLHPLQPLGFSSIGCMPCTSRTKDGEAPRAGRWRGTGKTECGIHIPG